MASQSKRVGGESEDDYGTEPGEGEGRVERSGGRRGHGGQRPKSEAQEDKRPEGKPSRSE